MSGESVRQDAAAERMKPRIQGWSAQVDPVSKLSFLEMPLESLPSKMIFFIRQCLTTQ